VHALRQPAKVPRARPDNESNPAWDARRGTRPPDPADPNQWELDEVVIEQGVSIEASGYSTNRFKLPAGAYRAVVESQDRFGRKVTARQPLMVVAPEASLCAFKVPQFLAMPTSSVEPGRVSDAVGHGLRGRPGVHRDRAPAPIQRF
jgi:hypothetical protein